MAFKINKTIWKYPLQYELPSIKSPTNRNDNNDNKNCLDYAAVSIK